MNKTTKNITLMIGVFLSLSFSAQKNNITISWQNGDVTDLKDLGQIWIMPKSGSVIKKVTIKEIQINKGQITYEKAGSLHDMLMINIDKVTAGENSKSILYFDNLNYPQIKGSPDYYSGETSSNFKVTTKATDVVASFKTESVSTPETVKITNNLPVVADTVKTTVLKVNESSPVNDTIVNFRGQTVLARIIDIMGSEIKFKRTDNPDGPTYIVNKTGTTEIIKYQNSFKVILDKQ